MQGIIHTEQLSLNSTQNASLVADLQRKRKKRFPSQAHTFTSLAEPQVLYKIQQIVSLRKLNYPWQKSLLPPQSYGCLKCHQFAKSTIQLPPLPPLSLMSGCNGIYYYRYYLLPWRWILPIWDFPSNAYSLPCSLYLPCWYNFLLGSTFLCSLIYSPRSLYPIGILYASYYVLLD